MVTPGKGMPGVLFMQSQAYFGADTMIHSLLMRYLDRDKFQVHVACTRGENADLSAPFQVLSETPDLYVRPTRFGPTMHARARRQVAYDAIAGGAAATLDLVHLVSYARRHGIAVVHGTEKPRDAFYGLLLARAIGAKLVVHLHVGMEDWISPLSRWAMAKADALIGVSEFVRQSMIQYGYEAAKSHTVLNALDPIGWPAHHPDLANSVRNEFDIPSGAPLILTASRLFPWKGQTELLKALDIANTAGRRFHLVVVGEDDPRATPGGGSYLEQLRHVAREHGLQSLVTFAGFRSDVPRLMNACDIFAMPSYEEPFGVVYLEAMAAAKPVVSLETGGTPEVVLNGKTGLLSPRGDTGALANNIIALLDDCALRTSMGTEGRERLESHFHPRRAARDVEQIYEALTQRQGEGALRR